ncbi:MAG: decaprenyl-phosphate phosphoribosyltransferase [Candidatus Eisenbacteria bacterium]|nr:decaprenyl-phosphate phosphoribosyltransferase [Candidatus Eisenbacteria bacterium]
MLKNLLIEARPWQYTKNLILFAGLVFAHHLLEPGYLVRSLIAFASFCLLSSFIYVLNDLVDLERDRRHPRKKNRPLASGHMSRRIGIAWCLTLLVGGMGLAIGLGHFFIPVAIIFVLLNALYSFVLKEMVILDVMAIALSFEVRAIAGIEALKELDPTITISPWLLVCTLFLALFLGFGKRRHELNLLAEDAGDHRPTLAEYSERYLDTLISIVTAGAMLAYAIYTVSPETVSKFHTTNLVYSIPFVVYGVFRYLYLIYERKSGGSPSEILLTDLPLALTIAGWVGSVFWVIYRGAPPLR